MDGLEGSGPLIRLIVKADSGGAVRGYLGHVPIPIDNPLESFDTAPVFGTGTLAVTRYLPDAKTPFTGQVALKHGTLAMDLAEYYLQSEQTSSAFHLSISFDKEGNVNGAGPSMVPALPGPDLQHAAGMAPLAQNLPSLRHTFSYTLPPTHFVEDQFMIFKPRFLADHRVEFFCHCSRDRMAHVLPMLPGEERLNILKHGPFPKEMTCKCCGTTYTFDLPELKHIFNDLP